MITEHVRMATADDAPALHDLERDARAGLVDARGGAALLAEQPPVDEWAASIDDPAQRIVVGSLDEIVFGYLQLRIDGETATVAQVYVHPEARELGLGDGMLAVATEAALAVGCRVLEGHALPGDRETKNLYERAGVTARKIIVSRVIR